MNLTESCKYATYLNWNWLQWESGPRKSFWIWPKQFK